MSLSAVRRLCSSCWWRNRSPQDRWRNPSPAVPAAPAVRGQSTRKLPLFGERQDARGRRAAGRVTLCRTILFSRRSTPGLPMRSSSAAKTIWAMWRSPYLATRTARRYTPSRSGVTPIKPPPRASRSRGSTRRAQRARHEGGVAPRGGDGDGQALQGLLQEILVGHGILCGQELDGREGAARKLHRLSQEGVVIAFDARRGIEEPELRLRHQADEIPDVMGGILRPDRAATDGIEQGLYVLLHEGELPVEGIGESLAKRRGIEGGCALAPQREVQHGGAGIHLRQQHDPVGEDLPAPGPCPCRGRRTIVNVDEKDLPRRRVRRPHEEEPVVEPTAHRLYNTGGDEKGEEQHGPEGKNDVMDHTCRPHGHRIHDSVPLESSTPCGAAAGRRARRGFSRSRSCAAPPRRARRRISSGTSTT